MTTGGKIGELSELLPFREKKRRSANGRLRGIVRTWWNTTGKPFEVDPPGLVIGPGEGLRIDIGGTVKLLRKPPAVVGKKAAPVKPLVPPWARSQVAAESPVVKPKGP